MRAIGMYGYVDKYDFVIAVAKTINIMSRSVLVIDATADDKYKYIVPAIANTNKYVTQYGEIDFAVGFSSYEELTSYLAENNIDIEKYSYVLLDVENVDKYEKFSGLNIDKSYLFIASNLVSINKNEELVKVMREKNPDANLTFSKVFHRAYMSRGATNYLEEKIANYAVNWTDEVYDISNDEQDNMVNIDSQYSGFIDIRKHTKPYILYLCEFVSKLLGDENSKDILREIKRRKN